MVLGFRALWGVFLRVRGGQRVLYVLRAITHTAITSPLPVGLAPWCPRRGYKMAVLVWRVHRLQSLGGFASLASNKTFAGILYNCYCALVAVRCLSLSSVFDYFQLLDTLLNFFCIQICTNSSRTCTNIRDDVLVHYNEINRADEKCFSFWTAGTIHIMPFPLLF